MSFNNRFPSNNSIWLVSNPKIAQRKSYEKYGKNAILYLSKNKHKKYSIINPKTNKVISFGSMDYEDFTKHHDEQRRKSYLLRSENIKGDWKNDLYSPNNLSRNILW
jgi:hypothetical protein